MSERAPRWVLLATAMALLAAPSVAHAQQTSPETRAPELQLERAALQRHLDSLLPLLSTAQQDAETAHRRAQEEARRSAAPVIDSFQVGPLHVVTLPGEADLARGMYEKVWREFAPFVDDSPALEDMTFTFQWATWNGQRQVIYLDGPARRVEAARWRPQSALEDNIRLGIGTTLGDDLRHTRIGDWLTAPIQEPVEGTRFYRLLAQFPAQVDAQCIEGDAMKCWSALGLDLDDNALDDWYSPRQRRNMATVMGVTRELEDLKTSCVQGGPQEDCDSFLEQMGTGWYRGQSFDPMPSGAGRGALVWLALNAGGPGAWDRLKEDPDMSPADALRYASGMSTRELSAAWRRWLMAQRPAQPAALDPALLITLLWMVAFAALAMRTTRWRLG